MPRIWDEVDTGCAFLQSCAGAVPRCPVCWLRVAGRAGKAGVARRLSRITGTCGTWLLTFD